MDVCKGERERECLTLLFRQEGPAVAAAPLSLSAPQLLLHTARRRRERARDNGDHLWIQSLSRVPLWCVQSFFSFISLPGAPRISLLLPFLPHEFAVCNLADSPSSPPHSYLRLSLTRFRNDDLQQEQADQNVPPPGRADRCHLEGQGRHRRGGG